ncbi:MAG: STAS domain-containing protein [Spirochaetales bacterium]|nr:STAS domain-containing protein [Spirochaetales bacterium]
MMTKKGSNKNSKNNSYVLPSSLMIEDASGFAEALLNMLCDNPNMSLDMRELERIDTSILQILYGLALEAKSVNKEVHFIGPLKDDLKDTLTFCSLLRVEDGKEILFPELASEGVSLEYK